ncbi:MAG: 4-hydroxy-tetrahydrodipicolinate reductase [Rhodobacteraceae bacterium]|nr:4-hydroxy-tetrahydrodipicolinate reductase [Paracoccaceae bacterium]
MATPITIAVVGASGRMGQMLVRTVQESNKAVLTGVTEVPGHAWIDQDLGQAMGGAETGVIVRDDPGAVFAGVDAVLDFSVPAVSVANASVAAQTGAVHVVGTTGFTPDDLDTIAQHAQKTVVVRAGNMSLGVNLLIGLTRQMAVVLDEDFDIEVIETHHRHKVDAPSGTALMLGQAAADGRGISLEEAADRGRDGLTGVRRRGKIGFHAIRGGDVVGEHDVVFAADGERIVIRHLATDRGIFARGAVKAALWGKGKPAGEYDMMDVLGLR